MIQDLVGMYGARLRCLLANSWRSPDLAVEIASIEPGFDCFIVNRAEDFDDTNSVLIEAIAAGAGRWVEVFGNASEAIHDAIDAASVRVGRQRMIGEGDPMTTWNDDLTESELATYIWTGGQGDSDRKLVIVVGMPLSVAKIVRALIEHQC